MVTPTAGTQDSRRPVWAAVSLLLLITTLVYIRVARFDFVMWDDDRIYYANTHIQSLSWENLRWMLTDTTYNALYHPLGWLSYALSYAILGANPGANHLVNLAFHLANTLLVFFLIRRLISQGQTAGWKATAAAFVGALFWAIHPLRVEPVSWVGARFHLIASCLIFIALHSYLSAVMKQPEMAWRKPAFWGAFLLYVCSVLTFPSGVMFPFVLILMDAFILQRRRDKSLRELGRFVLEKLPYILLLLLAVMASVWGRYHAKTSHISGALERFGIVPRLLQACYVWIHYLAALIWPTDLAPMYPRLYQVSPLDPFFWGCVFLLLVFTLLAFLARKRYAAIWGAWLCYLVFLIPYLGLSQHPHYASDRYSYIAAVIWSAGIAAGLLWLWSSERIKLIRGISVPLVAILLVLIGMDSFMQTSHWRNSTALFSHALAVMGNSPNRETLYVGLANTYLEKNDPIQALAVSAQALAIAPDDPAAQLAKAFALYRSADLDPSLRTIRLLAAAEIGDRLRESSPHAEYFLIAGAAHYQLSHFAVAEECFSYAAALNPTDVRIHLFLAEVLYRENKLGAATDELDRIIARHPDMDRNQIFNSWASSPPPASTLPNE